MKDKLLIINQAQFGYHIDTYCYCKYLRDSFDITYICWDYTYSKIELDNISIHYISRMGNIAVRNIRFILYVLRELKKDYSFHIIKYFRGCSILRILNPSRLFLFDIRTGSVNTKAIHRNIYNFFMKTEARAFKNVSIISRSLAEKLGLLKRAYILPLGADVISETNKTFESIDLLYVGTLNNRNIDQTIKGFSRFYHENIDKFSISYTIIGNGYNNEIDDLKKFIASEDVSGAINLEGHVSHANLKSYFDQCNVGVSYIPKTKYFDVQPPTKTFEYLLSGMPVIATNTFENSAIVNENNGVIVNDNPNAFYNGIQSILQNLEQYKSDVIRKNFMQFNWSNITADLESHIEKIRGIHDGS